MDQTYNLQSLFAGRLFRVPDYQRGYAWEERQWQDLLEDLDLLGAGQEHYTGTLVLRAADEPQQTDISGTAYSVYDIVDGQQRLTTLLLLLDAVCRELATFERSRPLASGLRTAYVQTKDLNCQPLPKLTLNRDCHVFFSTAILEDRPTVAGPTIHSHRLLAGAKSYFDARLGERRQALGEGYEGWLDSLRQKITQQLTMLLYIAKKDADAGVIFETMNNRGKPISEFEKVKNYLLYLSTKLDLPSEHDLSRRVNDTWGEVFQQLMAAHLVKSESEDQLLRAHWLMAYDHQAENWKNSHSIKERFNLRRYAGRHAHLLADLLAYVRTLGDTAVAYCDAYNTRGEAYAAFQGQPLARARLLRAGEKLVRLGTVAPFLPLLVAVRIRYPSDSAKYLATLELCEKFAFRVIHWFGRRSTTGRSTLYRLGNEVFRGRDLAGALQELSGVILGRYCSDAEFNERFEREHNWYKWSALKYFLYEYEEHLAEESHQPVKMPWSYLMGHQNTIEHILPQQPAPDGYWSEQFSRAEREQYTHDIGNLSLTYNNAPLGNKPFNEKVGQRGGRVGYCDSTLFMEHRLAGYADWTPATIVARRKEIAAWAMKRWHVDAPPAGPPPDGGRLGAVQHLADERGVGEAFRRILEMATEHGLYPNAKKKCVVFAPPHNRSLAVFTVWVEYGKLNVGVWPPDSYPYCGRIRETFGREAWFAVREADVESFIARFESVFAETDADAAATE